MDRLVSAIIPVYNGQKHLAEAIDSVLAQDHPHMEVIAVNDGSTDDSLRLLESYGSRVTVISQPNAGVAAARNAGIAAAGGQFIAFLDQDDYWRPTKVAAQLATLCQNDQGMLVHTGVDYFDESRGAFVEPQDPAARPELMTGQCYDQLLLSNPIVNSSVMVRRSVLDQVGVCDTQIQGNTVQDYDLWLRIAKEHEFRFVPDAATVFRLHSGQGHKDRRPMLREELGVLRRQLDEGQWRSRPERRTRIQQVLDELATAHFEAGSVRESRKFFYESCRWKPSAKAGLRCAASLLPFRLVAPLRLALHRMKRVKPR